MIVLLLLRELSVAFECERVWVSLRSLVYTVKFLEEVPFLVLGCVLSALMRAKSFCGGVICEFYV